MTPLGLAALSLIFFVTSVISFVTGATSLITVPKLHKDAAAEANNVIIGRTLARC